MTLFVVRFSYHYVSEAAEFSGTLCPISCVSSPAMTDVAKNLKKVRERMEKACLRRPPEPDLAHRKVAKYESPTCPTFIGVSKSEELQTYTPRLVAVTKTKPKENIIQAYKEGQLDFGENYVQEFVEKAFDEDIKKECPDIKWHFIGHLQSNKVKKLLTIPNLFCVQTVHSAKLAEALNAALDGMENKRRLNVFIQVNTSREEEKSGCTPEEVVQLVKHVVDKCRNLKVIGLMTIGKYHNYDPEEGLNPDFRSLVNCRAEVCKEMDIDDVNSFELSMGMSADFEHAIELGATTVRVGTAIFGGRFYNKTVDRMKQDNL